MTISPKSAQRGPKGDLDEENSLEGQSLASRGDDGSLDAAGAELAVRVRDRLEGAGRGRVGGAAEGDVADDGVADLVAVVAEDGLGGARLEDAALDQELGAHAGVDAAVAEGEVVVAGVSCVRSRTG
jgi:hypothetical protein